MRELVYYVAVSLDGYIAAPDHTFDAFPVAGDHIDMIVRDYTDTLPGVGLEALGLTADNSRFDTVLMGRHTYTAGLSEGVNDPYPHLRQFVFTRSRATDASTIPEHITLTDEDPLVVARRLKAETSGTGIWVCGGGQLAGTLLDEIDRLILKVNPLVFGSGIPMFGARAYDARRFTLIASTPYQSGVIVNEYVRA